ncbi:PIG-L deacetylase family protein [Lentisalinibacter orientalis]|uniref:PIG-L deacetylase family protein n=1 Tax=Lentisalinibacter orientalis TaxID=2992241 RepID=UPI00386B1AE8
MIGLDFSGSPDRELGILCLGAHSDDIEIGAGGTVLELARRYPGARIAWHVLSAEGRREDEARESAGFFTKGFASVEVHVHGFADGTFPSQLPGIKQALQEIKEHFDADIVITHNREDLHQDHRTVGEVTLQTFRDHLILEYEILKYDGDIGRPNAFFPLSDSVRREKLEALQRYFGSQRAKDWFSEEAFSALMRIRGVECRSPSGYAEAFYCRKALLSQLF